MNTRCLCEHANFDHSRSLTVSQPTSIITALRVLGPRGGCVRTGCQEFCAVSLEIDSSLTRTHPVCFDVRTQCLYAPNQIVEHVVRNTSRMDPGTYYK